MRYSQQITIQRPASRVAELFDSSENMLKWFPDLKSFEHISGEPGTPGAKSRMVFETKRGDFELIETITANNLPDEFIGVYDTLGKGLSNTMANRFIPLDDSSTRYETDIHYTFSGFRWKFMSLFFRPVFKRQSFKVMRLFKDFVESQPVSGESADTAERESSS